MRQFTRFRRKLCIISVLLEIFRRLKAISIAFHTPSAMHARFIVETIIPVQKMRPFTWFWRKLCVTSILMEIFRRLNATSIAFYTPNAMYAAFSVLASPTVRKMRPYTRFWRKLSVISLLLEIFRRLIATSIAFYTPVSSSKQSDLCEKCDHLLDFDEKCALCPSCCWYFEI